MYPVSFSAPNSNLAFRIEFHSGFVSGADSQPTSMSHFLAESRDQNPKPRETQMTLVLKDQKIRVLSCVIVQCAEASVLLSQNCPFYRVVNIYNCSSFF